MKLHIPSHTLAALLLACTTAALPAIARAATGHDHDHATAAAKPLPAGKRWATDAPLREGMTQVRRAFEPKLRGIHRSTLPTEDYQALAATTEVQIANIVSNCKLEPDADAALHGVLAKMSEGMAAMAGKSATKPRDGAILVLAALDEYGRSFNHPGWKPMHR